MLQHMIPRNEFLAPRIALSGSIECSGKQAHISSLGRVGAFYAINFKNVNLLNVAIYLVMRFLLPGSLPAVESIECSGKQTRIASLRRVGASHAIAFQLSSMHLSAPQYDADSPARWTVAAELIDVRTWELNLKAPTARIRKTENLICSRHDW